jgi:Membrane protein of 12 TMs
MAWRAAFRLSQVAFVELSFQAIYAFRQGNLLPVGDTARLVPRARVRVLQSKALVAGLLGLVTLGAVLLLHDAAYVAGALLPYAIPVPLFDTGVLTALLSLDVAFLWWTGLQVLPTFLSSGLLPVLEPLPIDPRTLRQTATILYLRLFDLPALTLLVGTPLLVGFALGPLAGLAILPGVVAAVVFALALALLTGRFFVRRIQGSRGGGGRTLLRWTYLVLWVLPAFGMFGFVTLAPSFFSGLTQLAGAGPSFGLDALWSSFPFSLAAWPVVATLGPGALPLGALGLVFFLVASAGYLALTGSVAHWMGVAIREVGLTPSGVPVAPRISALSLHPTGPAYAVVVKDLRMASRTPGYAFLILLPILDAFALGLLTYLAGPRPGTATGLAFAAVTTAALLAIFFGPAFFAIEVVAYSYGRTLPLPDRTLVLGKVTLIAAIYLVAAALVLAIASLRVDQPLLFLGFIAAELPAVVAASLLELGILLSRARRRGLPLVNLYTGAWVAVLVSIPGLFVGAAPLVAYELLLRTSGVVAVGGMSLVALGSLALIAPFVLGGARR